MATLVYNDQQTKEAEDKNAPFSFLLPPCLSPLHLDFFKLQPPRVREDDNMDVTLILAFFFLSTDLVPTTQPDGEPQQKGERRHQHSSTNSRSTSNGSNQSQQPTACYRASLLS